LRLRFTGTCDASEFERRCADHDYWYHSFYFDNGFERRGDYDIGQTIESYGFPGDLTGLNVLDIGTGSGWFAVYFEQLGANVTTVDSRGYSDFDVWGRFSQPDVRLEKPAPDRFAEDGQPIYYSPVSRGFWVMKDILGLRARYVNARVYDVSPELFGGQTFDIVYMGALLMHVRDPVGALMAARSVCKGLLVANSLTAGVDTPYPVMQFINNESQAITWWAPNRDCLAAMARGAGFHEVDVSRSVDLVVDHPYVDSHGASSAVNQTLSLLHARP
jgi:SAM-dependent methyltransferase